MLIRYQEYLKKQAEEINAINTQAKCRKRIQKIYQLGGTLHLKEFSSENFRANLRKLDTKLPEFLAAAVIHYFLGNGAKLPILVSALSQDPLLVDYNLSLADYEFKFKELLRASVVGMMPKDLWDGKDNNFGGMLLVKKSGEILCSSYCFNRDNFLTCLFNNAFLDTPSVTRHKFGKIESTKDGMILKLNFQIRIKD